jgi:hypothetical protein
MGQEFPEDPEECYREDGSNTRQMMEYWYPWIDEATMLMDGFGAFWAFKYGTNYSEQPFIDIQIYKIIRNKRIEMGKRK